MPPTNVLLVFADQMRGQALRCAGNSQLRTPHLDRLAAEGTMFRRAFCNSPVCTPSRGSLLTGRFPLTHRAYVNDMPIRTDLPTLGTICRDAGYATGYVGKWHLDGVPRDKFTPPGPRRLGFDTFWAVHNCTHDYMDAFHYRGTGERIPSEGYEPEHQTRLAIEFLQQHRRDPFCLAVSYGTPHDPYRRMPEEYLSRYDPAGVELRPNVPQTVAEASRKDIAGYYGHVTAIDEFVGRLMRSLDDLGLADNTLVVFTSDHGDMLGSHALVRKQKPWEESISIPLLWRLPGTVPAGRATDALVGVVDLLPTMLGLTGLEGADGMHGRDLSAVVRGQGPGRSEVVIQNPAFTGVPSELAARSEESVLILNPAPIDDGRDLPGWWGLRTPQYTYARTLDSPWVLFDNVADPYQMTNLAAAPEHDDLRRRLDDRLQACLDAVGEPMRPWPEIIREHDLVGRWNERELHLHPPETGRSRLLEE